MTDTPRHDLLAEPLLSIRCEGRTTTATLPALLRKLARAEPVELSRPQRHQLIPTYHFLVQLAALSVKEGEDAAALSEETWCERLLALSDGQREPWCLVVPDLAKPALLQPPIPEGTLEVLKKRRASPSKLDLLVTAKNHDVKANRIGFPHPEHWFYGLLTLQTFEGYQGRGLYGISRMNTGLGSRPSVGFAPSPLWGPRFARDLDVLRRTTEAAAAMGQLSVDGHRLLWLLPWDGTASIPVHECHPYFIEVCRRLRLTGEPIEARRAATTAPRLDAKEAKGSVGDPWIPIDLDKEAALTLSARGFSYDRVHDLVFSGKYRRMPALELGPEDPETVWLIASALARGQGQTDGLHERCVPVPGAARRLFGSTDGFARLGRRSHEQLEIVKRAQSKVLRPALATLLQGAPARPDLKDGRLAPWMGRHDTAVDAGFFDALWKNVDHSSEDAGRAWSQQVLGLAEKVLVQAIGSVPLPTARKYRVIAAANGRFRGAKRKHFPELRTDQAAPEEKAHV